jgi:hypothetical protein
MIIRVYRLRSVLRHIASTMSAFHRAMPPAAVLLAFFGMLRVSEYTAPSIGHFDPGLHLTVDDVQICWARQVALITLKSSKTDPFRVGVTLRIGVTHNALCPVHALLRFLVRRGGRLGPLFLFADGRFLIRAHITDLLHRSLPFSRGFNTHSFRRGGASALAAAGQSPYVIQTLGRWKSDAYVTYVQLSDEFLVHTTRIMAHATAPADP